MPPLTLTTYRSFRQVSPASLCLRKQAMHTGLTGGDDIIPAVWTPDSSIPLSRFLEEYKPSRALSLKGQTLKWLWVTTPESVRDNQVADAAVKEASSYLEEVTWKVEHAQKFIIIPPRGPSMKDWEYRREARERIRHGYVVGKWLIFAPWATVDDVWSTIATSLISGPLSHTCAYAAKVSIFPPSGASTLKYNHVLCLYMPDIYDKDSVKEVLKVLVSKHGMHSRQFSVKSDLYTLIGLYSNHRSGLSPMIWKDTDLLSGSDLQVNVPARLRRIPTPPFPKR